MTAGRPGSAPGITVIGDALLDVLAAPSASAAAGSDVPAAIRIGPGGQGANVTSRLARRGLAVRLVCALGDDAAGALVRDALAADGVLIAPIAVPSTGSVVAIVDQTGERTMLSDRRPFAGAIEPAAAEWLVTSGYLLLEPDGLALAERCAGAFGRRVVAGCAISAGAAAHFAAALDALRPDLLILNRDEAAILSDRAGDPAPALAARFATGVVVTDRGGAVATLGGHSPVRADAPRIPGEAVDTTGAGDAFTAALVGELVRVPWPPSSSTMARAVEVALGLAGAVARVPGAQSRVPDESTPGTLGA